VLAVPGPSDRCRLGTILGSSAVVSEVRGEVLFSVLCCPLEVMALQRPATQLCQRFQGLPASLQGTFLPCVEILHGPSGAFGGLSRIEGRVWQCKPQSACRVMSKYFILADLLLYEKLHVLGDEPIGCELADHTEGPPVQEPLGAHTESNGSHEIAPWGRIRVWSSSGRRRGSKLSRPMARR